MGQFQKDFRKQYKRQMNYPKEYYLRKFKETHDGKTPSENEFNQWKANYVNPNDNLAYDRKEN